MTIDIALNRKDGDIVFASNNQGQATIFLIDGADRLSQKISITLKMWLADWFLDLSKGIPYLEVIFEKRTRRSTIESILRSAILSVAGVRRILDFSIVINPRTRIMTVDFIADTVEGRISNSTVLDKIR